MINEIVKYLETLSPPKAEKKNIREMVQKFSRQNNRIESDQISFRRFSKMKSINKPRKEFSDNLSRASFFLKKGHKDAACIIASNTLENFLRNLCEKFEINIFKADSVKLKKN
ncbi:MAG: hypothetical protein KJI71_05045 [Patescibacteria group bacterium]|nr:hypothetical protein [Patescibacteria group bacterium]